MKQAVRPIQQIAGRVVEKHLERYRGRPGVAADLAESKKAAEWLRYCLGESDLLSFDDRTLFYGAVAEGLWPTGYGEDRFGATAFEVLVQFARYYSACRVTPRVLDLVRRHSLALESDALETLGLARAVTDECRRRYRPHLPPLSRPPEILARPLRRSEAAKIALAYWIDRYREETEEEGDVSATKKAILAEPSMSNEARWQLAHDLREGYRLSPPPARRPASRKDAARYRVNLAVALAAAIDVYRREGWGFSGVVAERSEILAKRLGIDEKVAFGYLYYLARHSR